MSLCLAIKWDHPDDPAPMRCARAEGHDGDHSPTSHANEVWTTWSDEEEAP